MGKHSWEWRPKGVVGSVLLFESPVWVTQAHTVRQMDHDNRVKPVFDAIQQASGMPDEIVWEFHAYKIYGAVERTIIFLFDLGEVVDYHKKEATP
jgi:Holliday junction resolvase RusA-like endonuclease